MAEETGTAVEIKVVDRRRATNRAGAAEYLGMPLNTVRMYSSRGRRMRTGWPEPLTERIDGQEWFALDELDAYRQVREGNQVEPPVVDDPNRLIDAAEFAALRRVGRGTFKRYVELSLNDWADGRDGYLPRPAETGPARGRGSEYRWRFADVAAWAFPATRRISTGRPLGRRPETQDVRRVLAAAAERGEFLTSREIAGVLSEEFGQVSLQTVHRLKRRMREEDSSATTIDPL